MSPTEELQALLAGIPDMPDGLNIYPAPAEQIVAPALVIRADAPWLVPSRFCHDEERYAVIAAVTASTVGDGINMLRSMLLAIVDALESPWMWEEVGSPVVDESTGTPFLAARLRLIYRNGGPE